MSTSPAMSNEIGPLFLRAFGVDMSNVVGFTLRCESGELALLEIRRAAPASRLADVECAVNIVSQAYRLEPVGNAAVVSPDVSASIGLADVPVETSHRPAD